MPDLGDDLNIGGHGDFFTELAKEQGVAGFNFPTEEQAAAESGATPPVVPDPGVAPVVPTGSSAAPAVEATPETPVTREELEALRSELANAQSLIGRQGQELGELRKGAAPPEQEQEYSTMPVTDEQEAQLIDMIEKHGGEKVAQWAAGNAPHVYETVLDLWSDPDISGDRGGARKAASFDIRYQNALQEYGQEQERTQREQFITEIAPLLDEQVTALGPEFGLEVGTPEVDALLAETLDQASPALKNLTVSRDAEEREAGLRAILALAAVKGKTPPVAGSDPVAEAALAEARAKALAAAKGEATLGTGGLQLESGSLAAPATPEADLAARIVQLQSAPKPTSVASGLTGGGVTVPA